MRTTSSPGSTRGQAPKRFASDGPFVTSTWSGVAPGYSAAIRVRNPGVPFPGEYASGDRRSVRCRSSSGRSSSSRSGRTPLSERLYSTECSQVDCHRSIAKGTIFIRSSGRDSARNVKDSPPWARRRSAGRRPCVAGVAEVSGGRLQILKNSALLKYEFRHLARGERGAMKRLGVVENLSYDGTVLVRSEFAPSRGATVVDKRNRAVGTVVRVFGPVREPFAAARPKVHAPPSLLGAELFVSEGDHARKEDRRSRRSHEMS